MENSPYLLHSNPDGPAQDRRLQNGGHYYAINVKINTGHLAEISVEQSAGGFQ